ncbi:hypothetical protein NAD41_000870 [Salmonella enterica]|nr:hypothetical protein [Salmonella enterica]EKK6596254.1 hypothetical protein [Salmonella enterica]
MIKICFPEACGNAIRLILDPPAGATYWRVTRSPEKYFKHFITVLEGTNDLLVDTHSLENEVMVHYRVEYVMADGSLQFSNIASATPRALYEDLTTDTLELLRDRLEAGLAEEVKRGALASGLGHIQVLTAPPSLQNNLSFPLVTLLLENESPAERFLGDQLDAEGYDDEDALWAEYEGWMADVNISITGWSLNPTERIELRKSLRRVLIANFNVFAARGILLPQFTLTDADAVSGEFDAPLYLVNGDFTCQAPVRVGLRSDASVVEVLTEVINGKTYP